MDTLPTASGRNSIALVLARTSFVKRLYPEVLLMFLTVILRTIPALETPLIGDLPNYIRVGEAVLAGNNPYSATNVYPYPPIWMWIEAGGVWLARFSELPFQVIIKTPLILSDAAISVLLYKIGASRGKRLAILLGLLYAFNPVSILITGFHGQFDTLAIMATLLSVHFLNKRKERASAVALSLAIGLKAFPILVLPFFLIHIKGSIRNRITFASLATVPVGIILAPFLLSDFQAVKGQLFDYAGMTDYGWAALVRAWYWLENSRFYIPVPGLDDMLAQSKTIYLVLYGFLVVFSFLKKTKPPIVTLIAISFCLFYFVYGGIASQYLIWAVPFLLLTDIRGALFYTLSATLALLGFYSFFFQGMISWLSPFLLLYDKRALLAHLVTGELFWISLGFLLVWKLLPSWVNAERKVVDNGNDPGAVLSYTDK